MPSLLPGYQYDIFISYRQNDNADGWVSKFIEALEKEIRVNFKQEVSIYFDENPHDGLSDTHDVDQSLKDKIKCLVFIPVISRTYCDPESFAWAYEFSPFLDFAKSDEYGLDVNVGNGNVSKRVLPIRIHDLDSNDIALYENAVDGKLRSVDFVYHASGVNRPLLSEDDARGEAEVLYRDQVNKVANAIRDLINGMIDGVGDMGRGVEQPVINEPVRANEVYEGRKRNPILVALLIVFLGVVLFLIYKIITNPGSDLEASASSIAVIPFHNSTGNDELDHYGVGLASEVRTNLALNKQFDFISSMQATLAFKNSTESPQSIGNDLGVTHILTGIYSGSVEDLQVIVELVETQTGSIIWSEPIETDYNHLRDVQTAIAEAVMEKFDSENLDTDQGTLNMEAFAEVVRGRDISISSNDPKIGLIAAEHFKNAIRLDSSYLTAWSELIGEYSYHYFNAFLDTAITIEDIVPLVKYIEENFEDNWEKSEALGIYAYWVERDYQKGLEHFNKVLAENPEARSATGLKGAISRRMMNYPDALESWTKVIKMGSGAVTWRELGLVLGNIGDFEGAEQAQLNAYKENPDIYQAYYAIKAKQSKLEEIPEELKRKLGLYYDIDLLLQRREFETAMNVLNESGADSAGTTTHSYYKSILFQLLEQYDSAVHYAKIISEFDHLTTRNRLRWPMEIKAILGHDRMIDVIIDGGFTEKQVEQDKFFQIIGWKGEVYKYCARGEYEQATEVLKKINADYPAWGDYLWLDNPKFDKIKREYQPFQEAIDSLKIPVIPTKVDPGNL